MTRSAGNETISAPYPIRVDVSHLSDGDKLALRHILVAMEGVDQIFRKMTLQPSTEGPFIYNPKLGREFYPIGKTQEEFEAYLTAHPEKRSELLGETTAIRSHGEDFIAVPYSELYKTAGQNISEELVAASRTVDDHDLGCLLFQAANAFVTDEHDEADREWIRVGDDLDEATLELTIGFHERDLDDWWGIKRSVQAVVGLVNREETQKLRAVQERLMRFDAVLGEKYGYVPNAPPITLVAIDQIECAGWAAHHLVPTAYILPNNPEFRSTYGGKQVFSWSILRARFDLVTRQIGLRILPQEYQEVLDLELLKLFVAAHECGHGTSFEFLGRDFNAHALPFEEGRADIVGLYAVLVGAGHGHEISTRQAYATVALHLVDGLRQIRINPRSMHAVGSIFQYNWLMDRGALRLDSGKMHFEPELFLGSYATLCDELYRVFSSKDEETAKKFIDTWGVPREELVESAGGFSDLPRDLDPQFEIVGLS
jgi:hypothetical protein